MSKSLLLMLCLLTGLLVLACAKTDTNRNVAPATSSTPATTTNRNDNAPTTADKVGVAECDNFITAYEACVSSKVPAASREQLKAAVAQWRTNWKKLADNPQTRGTLAAACKTQVEATRTQMKAYGCTF
jgi:phage-related tail fiber protein